MIGAIMFDKNRGLIQARYAKKLDRICHDVDHLKLEMLRLEQLFNPQNRYAEFVLFDTESRQATDILSMDDFR